MLDTAVSNAANPDEVSGSVEKERQAAAGKDPPKEYTLNLLNPQNTSRSQRSTVDIVAVQDYSESVKTAWIHAIRHTRRDYYTDETREARERVVDEETKVSVGEAKDIDRKAKPPPGNDISSSRKSTEVEVARRLSKTGVEVTETIQQPGTEKKSQLLNSDLAAPTKSKEKKEKQRAGTHWLSDSEMLPAAIPSSLIWEFRYPESKTPPWAELDRMSQTLLDLFQKEREKRVGKAPALILFVGHGFGSLIIQKLIIKAQKSAKEILALTAGLFFLSISPEDDPSRLRITSTMLGAIHGQSRDSERKDVWAEFLNVQSDIPPTTWLYRSKDQNNIPKKRPEREGPGINADNFRKRVDNLLLSRFTGTSDPTFQDICTLMKQRLLFKAVTRENFKTFLEQFANKGLLMNLEDTTGNTAIHLAASIPRKENVQQLINYRIADVNHKNRENLTAIDITLRVARGNSDQKELIEEYKDVIRRLRTYGGTYDQTSTSLGDLETVLREAIPLRLAPSASETSKKAKVTSEQKELCRKVETVLREFYWESNEDLRWEVPTTISELIYGKDSKPYDLFKNSNKIGERVCRWIHVPENNEQWIQDLFKRLDIDDPLMKRREDQESNPYARYIKAEGRVYNHDISNETQTILTTSNSAGGTASVRITGSRRRINLAFFVPFLTFEASDCLREMDSTLSAVMEKDPRFKDITPPSLISEYLKVSNPLHIRRTLHQFWYHTARKEVKNDENENEEHNKSALPMVDQLWLWLLNDGTIITSFPNKWDAKASDGFKQCLEDVIRAGPRRPIQTPYHLIYIIVKQAIQFHKFGNKKGLPLDEDYGDTIRDVMNREDKLLHEFRNLAKKLGNQENTDVTDESVQGCSIDQETFQLAHIKALQDKIDIVLEIFKQQEFALKGLSASHDDSNNNVTRDKTSASPGSPIGQPLSSREDGKNESKATSGSPADKERPFSPSSDSEKLIKIQSKNLTRVWEHLILYDSMSHRAKTAEAALVNLIKLKQNQANNLEARSARKTAQHAETQGKIILLFTVVTALFLPLSFLSSFFAINIQAFPRDSTTGLSLWPLDRIMKYMFGVSIGIWALIALLSAGFWLLTRKPKLRRRRGSLSPPASDREFPVVEIIEEPYVRGWNWRDKLPPAPGREDTAHGILSWLNLLPFTGKRAPPPDTSWSEYYSSYVSSRSVASDDSDDLHTTKEDEEEEEEVAPPESAFSPRSSSEWGTSPTAGETRGKNVPSASGSETVVQGANSPSTISVAGIISRRRRERRREIDLDLESGFDGY